MRNMVDEIGRQLCRLRSGSSSSSTDERARVLKKSTSFKYPSDNGNESGSFESVEGGDYGYYRPSNNHNTNNKNGNSKNRCRSTSSRGGSRCGQGVYADNDEEKGILPDRSYFVDNIKNNNKNTIRGAQTKLLPATKGRRSISIIDDLKKVLSVRRLSPSQQQNQYKQEHMVIIGAGATTTTTAEIGVGASGATITENELFFLNDDENDDLRAAERKRASSRLSDFDLRVLNTEKSFDQILSPPPAGPGEKDVLLPLLSSTAARKTEAAAAAAAAAAAERKYSGDATTPNATPTANAAHAQTAAASASILGVNNKKILKKQELFQTNVKMDMDVTNEKFFDELFRLQSKGFHDQRADVSALGTVQPGLFFDLIATIQSRRMDDQRASPVLERGARARTMGDLDKHSSAILEKLNNFGTLIRRTNTVKGDTSNILSKEAKLAKLKHLSKAPSAEIIDERLYELILALQRNRIEDQRSELGRTCQKYSADEICSRQQSKKKNPNITKRTSVTGSSSLSLPPGCITNTTNCRKDFSSMGGLRGLSRSFGSALRSMQN